MYSNVSRERHIGHRHWTAIQLSGDLATLRAAYAGNFATSSPNRGRYQWGNISCGPGRKYVDLRAMPPIDACVVLPLIHRSFILPLPLVSFLPLPRLPLTTRPHLSSSLSFSWICALVTLLHRRSIRSPSGRKERRGRILIFHRFDVSATILPI